VTKIIQKAMQRIENAASPTIYLKNSINISQNKISPNRYIKKSKIIYPKKYLEKHINISQLKYVSYKGGAVPLLLQSRAHGKT